MAKALRSSITSALNRSIKPGLLAPAQFRGSTLDLDFAGAKSLKNQVGRQDVVSFTRASTATYVDGDGLIKTSPVNLVTYSEELDQWTIGTNTTVTPNAATAPDGTLTADRVFSPAISGTFIYSGTVTPGTTYTASVWAKAVTPGTNDTFTFNIGGTGANASSQFTATDQWQRFTFTTTSSSVGSNPGLIINNQGDNFGSDVYFWGAQLEEGSTATAYIPTTSTISGAPRFDHDPATGESLGLLIEEARTNYITQSNPVTFAKGDGSTTITLNAFTAPDGTNTAFRIQGSNRYVQVKDTANVPAGSTIVGSYYIYSPTAIQNLQSRLTYGSGNVSDVFDLPAGQWVRRTTTAITDGSGIDTDFNFRVLTAMNNASTNVDVYVWGVQVEIGSFATSLIPTSGSTVTRAADVAEITGANFSSFYNQSEGTVFAEYNVLGDKTGFSQLIYDFSNGTNDNSIRQFKKSGNNETESKIRFNGSNTGTFRGNTNTPFNEQYKTAYAFDGTAAQRAIKGLASSTAAVSSMPTVDQLRLGARHDSDFPATCYISRFAYFPVRLPAATLKNITS